MLPYWEMMYKLFLFLFAIISLFLNLCSSVKCNCGIIMWFFSEMINKKRISAMNTLNPQNSPEPWLLLSCAEHFKERNVHSLTTRCLSDCLLHKLVLSPSPVSKTDLVKCRFHIHENFRERDFKSIYFNNQLFIIKYMKNLDKFL